MIICRTILMGIAALSLIACSPANSRDELDSAIERAIVAACESLVTDYAIFRDQKDADAYAAVFTEDGELVLPTATYRGRDTLRERVIDSRGKRVSKHLMSTTKITVVDAENATGISYATIYIEPARNKDGGPERTKGFAAVGEYHDTFRLTDRGWKFARREFVASFVRDQESST